MQGWHDLPTEALHHINISELKNCFKTLSIYASLHSLKQRCAPIAIILKRIEHLHLINVLYFGLEVLQVLAEGIGLRDELVKAERIDVGSFDNFVVRGDNDGVVARPFMITFLRHSCQVLFPYGILTFFIDFTPIALRRRYDACIDLEGALITRRILLLLLFFELLVEGLDLFQELLDLLFVFLPLVELRSRLVP